MDLIHTWQILTVLFILWQKFKMTFTKGSQTFQSYGPLAMHICCPVLMAASLLLFSWLAQAFRYCKSINKQNKLGMSCAKLRFNWASMLSLPLNKFVFVSSMGLWQSWFIVIQFQLAPMGVLAPRSEHAWPSVQPPIDTKSYFFES